MYFFNEPSKGGLLKHYLELLGSVVIVMLLFALSACGQKGDLYLPNIPPAPVVMGSALNSGSGLNDEQGKLGVVLEQDAPSQVILDGNLDENEEIEKNQSKLLEGPLSTEIE
ncbi:MAG: putative small lipoprotein YifL [Oleiphilaceae bacterium]